MKPYRMVKRGMDMVLALASLVLGAPLFALVGVLVKLTSSGPVLFRQTRVGLHGRHFSMLKFRTMKVGAPDVRNADGTTYNAPDDPRLTPIGALLRRSSLDELPQFWNVLKGEMSLVGGRPDLPEGVASYQSHQRRRLAVRPGVTGLAVVHGRNQVPLQKRRDLDAWYADNYTFSLDLQIITRTLFMVLGGVGVTNEYSRTKQNEGQTGSAARE